MKELDENYKRLIMIRYILRNTNVSNKAELDREVKNMTLTRDTLIDLAEDIADCIDDWKGEKCDTPCISFTTLGRIMGVYGKIGKTVGGDILPSNLNRIAKYIGRLNWTSVVSMDSEDIEESMLREHKFAEDSGLLSQLDDGEDKYGTGLSRLISHNLLPKQIVDIRYGNGKLLRLKKLKEDDKFMVKYCDSRVLEKGWVISIPCFFVGVNVTGLDIRYNGDSIKDYYKSGGVVTSIKIVDDIW